MVIDWNLRRSAVVLCAQTIALTSDPVDPGATGPYSGAAAKGRPAPPSSISGYRILKPLSGGGMGEAYEAEEAASVQRVALKVIAPECAASAVAIKRFRQECRLASLISHPRCVFVLTVPRPVSFSRFFSVPLSRRLGTMMYCLWILGEVGQWLELRRILFCSIFTP